MGADNNINKAVLQVRKDLFLFRSSFKTAQYLQEDGVTIQSLLKGEVVLFCEHRGGYQYRYLLAVHYCLKSSS